MRRRRTVFQRVRRPGSSPGLIRSPEGAVETRIQATVYDGSQLLEERVDDAAAALALGRRIPGGVLWVDVSGLADAARIEAFAEAFGLHRLALEDVINPGHRPKVEAYETALFLVARMLMPEAATDAGPEVVDEQVSFFLGDGFVVTFQERPGDPFQGVRERLRAGRVQLRNGPAGYLFVALLDAVVDGYFPVLERLSEHLEALEERAVQETSPDVLEDVYRAKREIIGLRRAFYPLRDVTSALLRDLSDDLDDAARLNLRDVADHVHQAVDVTETYREIATSLVDVHLSVVGQRTNEVMRVLTVVTALFIPLSFLAAVYGMNFRHMPELGWRHGYRMFWLICAAVVAFLLVVFGRLGWLRRPDSER